MLGINNRQKPLSGKCAEELLNEAIKIARRMPDKSEMEYLGEMKRHKKNFNIRWK